MSTPLSRKLLLGLASLLLLLAMWQARETARNDPHDRSDRANEAMGDRRQRSETPVVVHSPATLESYFERLAKGMTDREIRWMIEDFQNAGLDTPMGVLPPADYLKRRSAQHRWYLAALTEGLRLQPEQQAEARAALAELLEQAGVEFESALEATPEFEHEGKTYRILLPQTSANLVSPSTWLTQDEYAPWRLCKLTPSQVAVGWHDQVMEERHSPPGTALRNPDCKWTSYSGCWKAIDPETGEVRWGDFGTGRVPEMIAAEGMAFPLSRDQGLTESTLRMPRSQRLLSQARGAHPAQLRQSLLLTPDLAATLMEALADAENGQ